MSQAVQQRYDETCAGLLAHPLIGDFREWASAHRPAGGCRGILIDCPWSFDNRSAAGEKKNPKAHYPCVSMDVLCRLPVMLMAANDCAIWSWATSPLLDRQSDCLKAWGFRYIGCETWPKGSKNSEGEPGDETWRASFGTGYVRRCCAEFLLIGARGEPAWQPGCRKLRNAFFDPAREHSRKPDCQYERIEQSVPGPYCEIFSRSNRAGWLHFGNHAGQFGDVPRA